MADIARLGMEVDSTGLREGQQELRNLVGEGAKAESAIDGQTKRTSANWSRMGKSAGIAIAAIGTGITLAVRGQLNDIDKLAKDAQRLALPVDMLSQMRHAAELSGASIEGMQRGLRNVSRTMVNNGERFEELGISIRGVDGEMRPVIEVFEDAADKIAAMEDGADKTALAMQLFGERAGPELIPMLNEGRDGIRAMREEADKLGLTISEDTAKAAQSFNDNITRLTGAGHGFFRMITAELAPTLERFSGIVVDLVGRFGEMSPRMRGMVSNGALFLVVLTPLVAVLGAFAAAIALIGAPAIAVAAGIAGITAAVIAFWPEIKSAIQAVYQFAESIGAFEAVKIFFDGMMQQGRNFINLFRAIFTADLPEIMSSLFAIFEQPLMTIMELWQSSFATPLREMVTGIGVHIRETFNSVIEWFITLPERFFEFGAAIINGLGEGINSAWEYVKQSIQEKVDWLPNWVKERLGIASPSRVFMEIGANVGRGLANGINGTFGMVQSAVAGLTSATTSSAFDMAKDVVGAMGQMFKGSKPIAAAQALINTFQGVTEALKMGPWGIPKAIAIGAMGMAQVAGILSAKPSSSGGATSTRPGSSGGATSTASPSSGGSSQPQNVATQRVRFEVVGEGAAADASFRTLQLVQEALDNGGRLDGLVAERVAA